MGRLHGLDDNAVKESFFSLLQKNVLNQHSRDSRKQLRPHDAWRIERTYHRGWLQVCLGELTPTTFEVTINPHPTQVARQQPPSDHTAGPTAFSDDPTYSMHGGSESMNTLVKFDIITLPKLYVVGKELRYSDEALNTGDNRLPDFWDECYRENIFAPLESQASYVFDSSHVGVFLDWNLGDGDFSYAVGLLMKEGVSVPDNYFIRELPETDVAVGWIKGKFTGRGGYGSVYDLVTKAMSEHGRSNTKMTWCMEMYNCPRFTEPNEDGDTILDCYIPVDK